MASSKSIAGPEGPIAYTRDALGYPAIVARTLNEGVFALGYLHAYDRLIQVFLTSLVGRGQLMSVLGDVPLARFLDRGARAVGMANDLSEQVAQVAPSGRALMQAYSAGFNQGAEKRGWPLPLRFLGIARPPYSPEQLISVFRCATYFGLTSMQLSAELLIAELCSRGAPERLIRALLGPHAQGLDLSALARLEIPPEHALFGQRLGSCSPGGSNAFAVSAARSATGGALLVGEFHLEIGRFPPPLYAAHLALPDNSLTGMTIPGVPWFVSGRTRHVGWSYTYAHADNVDVIAERIRSAEALVGDSYQPLRRRDERVEIRGRPSELWSFFENDYGTVLGSVDGEVDRPCIRTTGFRETHRVMSAAPRLLECRSVDDLLAVQREIRCTSLEAVMADVHGDIASVVTGQVDERPSGWSGAYPRPGWQLEERNPQPLSEQFRPHSVRPACGHLASANQGGQGAGPAAFCTLPEPHYRFARISELLAAKPRHSLASLVGISYDTFDRCALRLLAVWGALLPVHPRAQALFRWREEQRDRELLGLFHRLHSELCIAFFERDLGPADAARLRDQLALLHFQHHLDSVLALEHPELLDAVGLTALLDQAFARANSPPGKHSLPLRVRFKHLLTQGLSPALLGFDSKPIELPGGPMSAFTCRSTSVVDGYDVVGGPVFHLALDMKRPGIWYNIAGGASEARWGEGYGKGLDDWLKGKLIPMGDDGAARPLLAEPTDRPSV